MQTLIRIGLRQEFDNEDINEMYRLRARVFRDRMGWDIPTIAGMEIDGYDALEPHYMLIQTPDRHVCGCWRLMPTEGPNMLRDTFSELLRGAAAPASRDTWELSRFAIETGGDRAYGFTDLTMQALQAAVRFADQQGIKRYVTVTTVAIERLLRRSGLELERLAPPMRIGVENAVALEVPLGARTHTALFGPMSIAA